MSGLAEILKNEGYSISGSDMNESTITEKLRKSGMTVNVGHNADNLKGPDLVVYTAAIKETNPELAKARQLNIKTIDRATLLGEIMRQYPISIAVAGTHGKTTTTSMITMIMLEASLDPTVHIGGELDAIAGNTRIGGKKYFISEACEYVESFLKFYPFYAVILNIEPDHLDYFRDIEHIRESFTKFASLVPEEGCLFGNADDATTMQVLSKISTTNKVTFGVNNQDADFVAKNIKYDEDGCYNFQVEHKNKYLGDIILCVPGMHNLNNAMGAIAVCSTLGCDFNSIKTGLIKFMGTHRRFETRYVIDGIKVVDDYAHHPSEIKATLGAVQKIHAGKVWCVFQPHTYTRTRLLLDEFSNSFNDADSIIVADIYAAREPDTGIIHSRDLASKLQEKGVDAIYIEGFEPIAEHLKKNIAPGDIVLTMGAGDIYKVGDILKEKF